MEKFVNEVATRLLSKIPIENIEIVKNVLYITLQDYELTAKSTEIAVAGNDIPREAKVYLASRHIDGLSEKSLNQYKRTLEKFFFMVNKSVSDVTTEDCRIFFYKIQQEHNMSNVSLNNHRSYLATFFAWLVNNNYIQKNPCAPITPFKTETTIKKEFSYMELEKLRKACESNFERAIVEVLYSTACRVSELVNIKLEDIDMINGEVTIRHGKGNKERVTYLNAQAILAIQEYVKDRDYPTVYLFENFRKPHNQLNARTIEKRVAKLAELTSTQAYPHKFRRTTATHLWKRGMPLEEIQILLGHTDISTTMIYTNVNQEAVKTDHKKYLS